MNPGINHVTTSVELIQTVKALSAQISLSPVYSEIYY